MKLQNGLGDREIIEVIREHPGIGEILAAHEIGCTACSIGTCLLKDVVAVHFLGQEIEERIEKEINAFLDRA